MEFKSLSSDLLPMELLLEADPSRTHIASYLNDANCYVAVDGSTVVGTCVVQCDKHQAEIYNLAVLPERQDQKIGSQLMAYVLAELAEAGVQRVELGTGTFGYQLTFYQRFGFRVESVCKDYFLQHYSEPIFENGIQHKDMLRLYLDI